MVTEQHLKELIIEKAWKDAVFKQQLITDARTALKSAFDITIPEHIELFVVEETSSQLGIVLPMNPDQVLNPGSRNKVSAQW